MAHAEGHREDWKKLPWKKYQRNVFRLQKRIYQAVRQGDYKRARSLQRLLLHSWSARCLAVRQVSQDNRGKRTPGVDGVASLTQRQRIAYARRLRNLSHKADPVRRVYISKPNNPKERRPLGIPTMFQRALQALVKLALEPEWEALFEPNSYGFRPGRSPHDAIQAIFNFIRLKPKFVLDTDIEKCFDKINHEALLRKLVAIQPISKLVEGWLKAGIVDEGKMIFPKTGTPQGGVISPLLMNIALHGFEQTLVNAIPKRTTDRKNNVPGVIRYADDLVILHHDLDTLKELQQTAEDWLAGMGLRLKPSKTYIRHTLQEHEGPAGFDFLGFTIRQFPACKHRTRTYREKPGFKTIIKPSKKAQQRHLRKVKDVIRSHRGNSQAALVAAVNPVIRGWANYYHTCSAKDTFYDMDYQVYQKLYRWAAFRHRNKNAGWRYRRYWRQVKGIIAFSDGTSTLVSHAQTRITRHTKVKSEKSPFDGDWPYWSTRLSRDPTKPTRVCNLLKRQSGRCANCGLRFTTDEIIEVHHRDRDRLNNRYSNLALLHGHCHDQVHSTIPCL
jgi:RNA-directed DNA polymerase